MAYTTENTMEKREKRIADVVALKEPDRVPWAPKIGMAYAQTGNITMYEALMDFRTMKQGVYNFLSKYETDLFWAPAGYPSNVMEVLRTIAINWPGPTCNLPRTSGFQVTDITYMEEDEYDELISNPAHFFMTKVFPRRHKRLQGLSKLSFNNVVEFGHYASMAAFADPEVREALLTLMHAGDESAKWLAAQGELNAAALEMQTPHGCILGQGAPYDMLADNLRGYINLPMDLLEDPEKVMAAVDVMLGIALQNVHGIKAAGCKYVFMPLHGGTDDFMSDESYRKYYWPSLRRVFDEIISLDMIPYVFFEGKYNTRLEAIKDVPKGKCIYMFEQVDIAQAKKVLGDTVCITGNLPGAMLAHGNKQEIIDTTKKMIDDCAPGGGFIMDCSIVMDHFKDENMEAWYQTTLDYGKR